MELSSFKPRQPLSISKVLHSALDYILDYIASTVRCELYKTFYIGFYTIFDAISHLLKVLGGIPTHQAVMQAAMINASAVHFYLGKGVGWSLLDSTVDIAREQSCLGDGMFEDMFDHEEGEAGGELGYRKLVRYMNDFGFGGDGLGVGIGDLKGGVWRPYSEREEWDEEDRMDVDTYDDGDSD